MCYIDSIYARRENIYMPDLERVPPRRGRPKEECVQEFASGLMMSQREAKEALCVTEIFSLIGDEVLDQLPRKVLIELGRHVWADPELEDKVSNIAGNTEEEKKAMRLAIFAEYPWLLELYNYALSLKKQGWSASAIVIVLRKERMAKVGIRARGTWEDRYQAAVDAISLTVQRRAAELIEPRDDLNDMVRRLLCDAYLLRSASHETKPSTPAAGG
jgi:hypothetical protein